MKDKFILDPQIIFLNHGSFGATPKPVFDIYQAWQSELEHQPVEFLDRRFRERLAVSRTSILERGAIIWCMSPMQLWVSIR
jgi:isopenicillin-N epimerase